MTKPVRWGVLGCAAIAINRVIPGMQMTDQAVLTAVAAITAVYVLAFFLAPAFQMADRLMI